MRTKPFAIVLMLFCSVFTALGQFFWKKGSAALSLNIPALISNYALWLGFVFYFLGAILLIVALKNGELSVLYPFVALGFIWVAILSTSFLGEELSLLNWFGNLLIVGGVSFIGIGASK